ncbi:dicarboxylate/amino acid:cation symporter [Peristeroidobacter agariperforans]|uniref:dicarboxylate/amino acid:cation symporter n=1 Tax=Peristeroidobacter agariperforans TaxID=268404 RepID=UPI00101C8064|nr:dicarboxylate/amino acid:cation symporter [Peristeroidobacter agariperforans]
MNSVSAVANNTQAGQPFYRIGYVQVLIGIFVGALLGHLWPHFAVELKPLGDGFIRLIKMTIPAVIFCTVVSGIVGMKDVKKVGRVGVRSILYFEVVSTLALLIGLAVANWVRPGEGMNVDAATLDASAVVAFAGEAKQQSVVQFLLDIIPTTLLSAFSDGNVLQVVLVALLFGFVLSAMGERARPLSMLIDSVSVAVFDIIRLVLKLAPLGACGAIAFTVGRYGLASLGPLLKLVATFYFTAAVFIALVLGVIARLAGFSILKLLAYIREEIVLVFATSSSDAALPPLMKKMEQLGCSKSLVGLVLPTGYTFNTDGTSIYMTMAALFVAQATNVELSLSQQLAILGVAMVSSKGASGVSGAAFIALVATLSVIPDIPVAGMALLLGIERFMSEARALTNMIGNAVATIVMARWERELDVATLRQRLNDGKPSHSSEDATEGN